ncbi:DUF6923 family protein [Corynebacterium sp. H113]|uniref:DUF6923 family protein n=1 Tax=Corynebacterium sp. H113 TaxID=3133419 RepID=UPI0030A2EBF4
MNSNSESRGGMQRLGRIVAAIVLTLVLAIGIAPLNSMTPTALAQDAVQDTVTTDAPAPIESSTGVVPVEESAVESPAPETAAPAPTGPSTIDEATIKVIGEDPGNRVIQAEVVGGETGLGIITFERNGAVSEFLGHGGVLIGDREIPAEAITSARANGEHGDLITIDTGNDVVPAGTLVQVAYATADMDANAQWTLNNSLSAAEEQPTTDSARTMMMPMAMPMAATATSSVDGMDRRWIRSTDPIRTQTPQQSTVTPYYAWNSTSRTVQKISSTVVDDGYLQKVSAWFEKYNSGSTTDNLTGLKVTVIRDGQVIETIDYSNQDVSSYRHFIGAFSVGYDIPLTTGVDVLAGDIVEVEFGWRHALKTYPSNPKMVLTGHVNAVPQECVQQSKTFTTSSGTVTVPPMGDGTAVVSQLPPRELTQEEIDRGDVAYVTASSPNSQARYSSQLYYQPNAGTGFVEIGGTTGWVVNALAYNTNDNWLYAISQPRYGVNTTTADKIDNSQQYVALEDPCFPAGHLLQIDPVTGQIYNLGKVTGAGPEGYGFGGVYNSPWPNDLWGGINVGFFDKNGQYWVTNASKSGTGVLYKVDLGSVSATTNNSMVAFGTDQWDRRHNGDWCAEGPTPSTRTQFNAYWNEGLRGCASGPSTGIVPWRVTGEDFTYAPEGTGNYAWAIQNGWGSYVSERTYMERINLDTGVVQRFDITGLTNQFGQTIPTNQFGETTPSGKQWGKAWFYGNGNLAFGTSSGSAGSEVVQIQIINPDSATPTFKLISVDGTAPTSYNSNGTSSVNPNAPKYVDLEIQKSVFKADDANKKLTWRIEVTNLGPNTSAGFLVEDLVPTQYTNVVTSNFRRIDAGGTEYPLSQAAGDFVLAQKGNNFQVNFTSLAVGERVYFDVTATYPTVAGCFENSAKVTGLDPEPVGDANVGVNVDSDEQCRPTIDKNIVDANGDGAITVDDTKLPGPDGTRAVQYDIVVTGPLKGTAQPYTLKDLPLFANLVEITGAKIVSTSATGTTVGNQPKISGRTFGVPVPAGGWDVITSNDAATIPSGATHTYRIEVYYKVIGDLSAEGAPKECATQGPGAGHGLYNEAILNPGAGEQKDDDCGPIGEDDDVTLAIEKIDYEGKTTIISGAEFTIFGATADGQLDQNNVVTQMTGRTEDATKPGYQYYVATLQPDTFYYLVETKSPAGYSLLAQPVLFKIVKDSTGNQTIEFYKPGNPPELLPEGDGLVSVFKGEPSSATVAYMQVADVTVGDLPKTGGNGIGMAFLLGLSLVGAAIAYRRRLAS